MTLTLAIQHEGRGTSECGWASVIALAASLPILLIAGTVVMLLQSLKQEAQLNEAGAEARDAALTAVQDGLAMIARDPTYSGSYWLSRTSSESLVTITPWSTDGVDNNRNGSVDDGEEAAFWSIRAEGHFDCEVNDARVVRSGPLARTSSIDAVLERLQFDLVPTAAIYLDDPLSNLDLSGSSFWINGDDENPDGSRGSGASIPGIGVPGDPQSMIDSLGRSQRRRIQGAGGTPSVVEVPVLDLATLLEICARLATTTYDSSSSKAVDNELGSWVGGDIRVAYATGDLVLGAGFTGSGIIAVEGDLVINGAFDYEGVIVTGGSIRVNGGGKRGIHGAMMIGGDLATDGGFELNGAMKIQYSEAVLGAVANQVQTVIEVVSWIEE